MKHTVLKTKLTGLQEKCHCADGFVILFNIDVVYFALGRVSALLAGAFSSYNSLERGAEMYKVQIM